MEDLETCKRILSRKGREVHSPVRVVIGGIHWQGAEAECWSPDNTRSKWFELRFNPLYGVDPISLMHELIHVTQMERGFVWGSGEFASKTAPDLSDPEYPQWLRSYYRNFPAEYQAEYAAQKLVGTAETLEKAMVYLRQED